MSADVVSRQDLPSSRARAPDEAIARPAAAGARAASNCGPYRVDPGRTAVPALNAKAPIPARTPGWGPFSRVGRQGLEP